MNSLNIIKQTVKYDKKLKEIIPNTISLIEELNSLLSRPCLEEDGLFEYKQEFRKKVSSMFKTTPYVLKTEIHDEFFIQDGIKYLIRLFKKDIFATKEYSIDKEPKIAKGKVEYNNSCNTNNTNNNNTSTNHCTTYFDPFAPPFKPDFVVDDNFNSLNTHRIFFSKYPVMEEHLLIVTRDFQSQLTHLNYDDIKNAVSLIYVMNGLLFFNAGKKAGASQIRKHMQCIPLDKLHNQEFGLFLLLSDSNNLTLRDIRCDNNTSGSHDYRDVSFLENFELNVKSFESLFNVYSVNQFKNAGINHILIKFSDNFTDYFRTNYSSESIDVFSRIIFELYNICLLDKDLINPEDPESIDKDYSFLLTDRWMLVIPRKTHEVYFKNGMLNINSIGFLMMFMCNNTMLLEEVKNLNIIKDVFAELTE